MSATVNIETTALTDVKKIVQLTYPSFGMDDPLIDFNNELNYYSIIVLSCTHLWYVFIC